VSLFGEHHDQSFKKIMGGELVAVMGLDAHSPVQ
jgi:hypothetical protein